VYSPTSHLPEPWLRGTLSDRPPEQRAILHALQLALEDIARWCDGLSNEELHANPYGLPSIAFQLRHIAGSLDRLLTYAEGGALDEEQKRQLAVEAEKTSGQRAETFTEFGRGLESAEARIRVIDPAQWSEPRVVGRKQLPTTVAGLLIHCADHTQRHVGQAVTTAKLLLAMRAKGL
jgi:uncharacterized damage-inducible protein DinB